MAITTLLLDADGVTQRNRGFREAREALLQGKVTRDELFAIEARYLAGGEGFRDELAALFAERSVSTTADELLDAWSGSAVEEGVFELLDDVRAAGVRVCLATNQNPVRGQRMIDTLGYEDHTDGAFYSFQIGFAKPDQGFFTTIVGRLDAEPAECLFIDDSEPNVVAARAAGLQAEHMILDRGTGYLRSLIAAHGVAV